MKYLGIALLIGIVSGVIRSVIIRRHVLPYMERRGSGPRDVLAGARLHNAIAEYFRIQDPREKGTKLLLMCLKIPFVIALVIAAFGIYSMSKGDSR